MDKFKKIILLVISVLILSGVLFACSKQNDDILNGDGTDVEINTEIKEPDDGTANEPENEKEEIKNDLSDKNEQSSVPSKPSVNDKKDYSLSEIMSQIISVIPKEEHNMSEMPSELYSDMYGIDKSKFEDVLIYGSMMSVKSNEIILIKLKDENDASTAVKLLEARKDQVYKTWEQYLPDQFELVKQAKIKTNGKYVALIIAPYSNEVTNKFLSIK